MKRAELFFAILLLPIDYLMVVLAALSAYYLRVGSFVTDIRPVVYALPLSEFIQYSLIAALVWIVIFAFSGLYAIKSDRRILSEFSRIFLACSTGLLIIIVAIFLQRELFSSRFIILAAWAFSILYVTIGRIIVLNIQRAFLKRGFGAYRVVIIGEDKTTNVITKSIKNDPKLGYNIVAQFPSFSEEVQEAIMHLHIEEPIDAIIQTDPNLDKEITVDIIDFTEANNITFKFAADLYNTKSSRVSVKTLGGVPVFEIKKTPLDGWGRIIKRSFDIIASAVLLILFSPLMFITALAIKLESKGPILFSRRDDGSPVTRVGQYGKEFHYFKFRSMKDKTDSLRYSEELQEQNLRKDTPLVKIKDDPRITRVGKFIRKYSIDELPELFLVFIGKMSLVGPRPHLPEEVDKYEPQQRRVLDIKPGITGMAQISGRSDLSFEEEVNLDTYYIENWSLLLDIQILLKTPFAVLWSKRQAL